MNEGEQEAANTRRPYPRWYGGLMRWTGPKGVVQIESDVRTAVLPRGGERFRLPEPVLRLAQEEYDRQHPGQPYERMQERGGLGLLEIVGLLADLIERERETGPWQGDCGDA